MVKSYVLASVYSSNLWLIFEVLNYFLLFDLVITVERTSPFLSQLAALSGCSPSLCWSRREALGREQPLCLLRVLSLLEILVAGLGISGSNL